MELEELYDYKNQLMKDLCTDEEIVKLVTGNSEAAVPNHGMPYTQVYPFEHVPDTVDEAQTFICYDADIISVSNRTYLTPILYIWAFTHESNMRTKDGEVLVDKLAIAINRVLNGSRYYGLGELKLDSVKRFVPNRGYLGRVLVYYAKDFNRASGSKARPSNRRLGE